MEYNKLTDEKLVEAFRSGDEQAFETLYRRYEKVIKGFARTFYFLGGAPEDLWQEGFFGLYSATKTFDEQKSKESNSSFRTFAYSCIKYRMINAVTKEASDKRKALNSTVSIDETVENLPEMTVSPEDIIIGHERKDEITEKIKEELSEFERQVFDLYVEDYKYTEIADKLGVPAKSVDNALQRIKDKCKQSSALRSLFTR